MLINCSNNIPGPLLPPSYFPNETNDNSPVAVKFGMIINNLINVDDISSQLTMDFYYRLGWNDPRWFIPDLFNHLNPEALLEGLDITQYVRNTNQLNIWLSDLVFYQSTDVTMIAELIKLYPNGTIYWSRHLLATFSQPQMSFKTYPLDNQNFSFVIQSYAFDNKFIKCLLYGSPVILNEDSQQYNKPYLKQNQIWTYLDYTAYIQEDLLPSPYNPSRTYSTIYLNLKFQRQSLGVVFRLALPDKSYHLLDI
eukprot:gene16287-22184_t